MEETVNLSPSLSSPIAIIGVAFRFPGDIHDESTFWEVLKEGKDLVSHVPADRWATDELQHDERAEPGRSITFSAGVLSRIDEFDAGFFGISPREAAWLDPQQRLLLELAWESMENAGLPPSTLAGSDCAVYVGISSMEYGMRGLDDLASMTAHTMTGNTLSVAANRLSYVFDLHGPSLAVDTACSSSLVALHHACNSLRHGEASTALVGGINLLLHPYPFVGFTKASMLSAEGRCKAFDAAGSGYVRAEGAAVLLLKPLEKALADGDDIQAVILASGVNSDGARKTGITIPSSEGQAELMREVLARSGLSARDIDFVEAHGTGTTIGDPIEATAIGTAYGGGRDKPLPIGSVKANLGHMEPASGMAGLVKTLLALKHRALPPLLQPHTPNPHIDFASLNLELVPEYRELTSEPGKPLVAGISSFGFGGTNAHVLLQEFSPAAAGTPAWEDASVQPITAPPLFLSARSDAALRVMAGHYAELIHNTSGTDYYDIAHAAAHHRDRLEKRLALHGDLIEAAADLLRQYAGGDNPAQIFVEDALPHGSDVVFVYSGNGAQWVGMGRALLAESQRFNALIAELDARMQPMTGFSLLAELHATDDQARLDDTTVAQPLLLAIQVAVTRLLREFGLEPAAVTGHSVGEIAAAWAAGLLSLEQAIHIVCARSQAQNLVRGTGRMAVVSLSAQAIEELLAQQDDEHAVEIACINSPGNVTLSGTLEGLTRLQTLLEAKGVSFRLLELDYAFHSRLMNPIKANLAERLAGFAPQSGQGGQTRNATFVSTVTGDILEGAALDAGYWWRNVREPVRFAEAIARLTDLGYRVFVEIGPHAVLQRNILESLAGVNIKGRIIPSLRRQDDGLRRITEMVLRAHLLVDQPALQTWFPFPARRVRLPNYPWQRERHWQARTSEGLRSIERRRIHPLLGWPLADTAWENTLDPVLLPWLADHKVGNAIVYPGSAYAEMALAAARQWRGGEEHFVIEELGILAPMIFDGKNARILRLVITPRDGEFQIKSRQRLSNDEWTLHATGRLLESVERTPRVQPRAKPVSNIAPPAAAAKRLDRERHYALASALGLDYGPAFQGLRDVRLEADTLEARLDFPESSRADQYLLHPAQLDLCFQSLIDFFGDEIQAGRGITFLPVKIGRFELYSTQPATNLRARLHRRSARSVRADFELLNRDGELVARLTACRFRATPLGNSQSKIPNWRIIPWLRPHPAEGFNTTLPDFTELAERARTRLLEIDAERRTWFQETLPLIEAMTLSFAFEACQHLINQSPQDWPTHLETAYGRWLAELLSREGLLQKEADVWHLVSEADLPASQTLWQLILREAPACLAHLALMGRVGRQLPALLRGEMDGRALLNELRQSPMTEALYSNDLTYLGLRLAMERILQHLAQQRPAARRLRVLEITAEASELPKTLIGLLPDDQFDYVLALPSEAIEARQQNEYQDHANIVVTTFDPSDATLPTDRPLHLPDAFDVVILRHVLHRTGDPHAALAQARQQLAAGGLLILAERHPDWSTNFLEGIDPDWWHEHEARRGLDTPASSLHPPQAWRQALIDAQFADCQAFLEPAAEALDEGAYLLLAKRPQEDVIPLPAPERATWHLLVDETSTPFAAHLRHRLEALDQQVDADPQPAWATYDHIICLLGWQDTPEMAARTTARLLEVVQTVNILEGKLPHLWLIARGGALASDLPGDFQPSVAQSALWGFVRVVMNDCPQLACTLIDLTCDPTHPDTLTRLENELLRPDGASEIILSAQARHSLVMRKEIARHTQPAQPDTHYRLDFRVSGQLSNLLWLPEAERPLREDEIEVRTRATGLNFRDVMYLMGLLPDEAVENGFAGASLGLEFSGLVSRVGAQVKNLLPGDAVMGFGAACFASHIVTRADAVAPMPTGWAFEAAATVPTVFFTVYYALKHLADLQPGERVLIHGAAGGVGMAAVQLARHLGAEIYATAGSDEKRDFVRLLGADHVFDSRSLAFAEDVLAATAGEGVDVVLNSLAGEFVRRSLDVLKPFGRFLELGKRDFYENTPVGLRFFRNNISYFGIDVDALLTVRPQLAARLFSEVMALFREQILSPLPYRTFTPERIVDAFRVMQQARHIGKLVVSRGDAAPELEQPQQEPAPRHFEQDSTWLVTGGLSGFGLESARWLAARGVGHLVLASRRSMETSDVTDIIATFAAQGVEARVLVCDVTSAEAVAALIDRIRQTPALPPLKGILHAATTYDDRVISRLDEQSIQDVLAAKLLGAWHLHQATLTLPLDYFVLYSSVTTAIGNPGQANYVAANAGLEGLVALRRQMGLPVSCIAFGPIADVGYLVSHAAARESLEQRLGRPPITAAGALAQLDQALTSETGLTLYADFDWSVLARRLPSAACSRFDILNRSRKEQAQAGEQIDIRTLIAGKKPKEIADIVRGIIVQELAKILCIAPDRIEPGRPLHDQGMDSLLAVELALGLERRFGIQLPVMMLNDSPTVDRVTERIVEKLTGKATSAEESVSATLITGLLHQHGEGVTPEELASLTEETRKLTDKRTELVA